jgi:hypothetical protein
LGLGFGGSRFGGGDLPWPLDLEGGWGGGGCRTGGGGVWAERRAAATPPAGVVEEAGWAKVASEGEKSTAVASSWAANPAAEAPPKPGRDGAAAGTSKGGGASKGSG